MRSVDSNIKGSEKELHNEFIKMSEQAFWIVPERGSYIINETDSYNKSMELLGVMAGGIAHDFNNLINIIRGYAEKSLRETSSGNSVEYNLKRIVAVSRQAGNLSAHLLDFIARSRKEPEILDICSVVKEVTGLLKPVLPENVKIDEIFNLKSSLLLSSTAMIYQMLINLLLNSLQSINGKEGKIKISLDNLKLHEKFHFMESGNYLWLAVSDNGCGMEKTVMKQIFNPFFTTKNKEEGNGIGLSIVYEIVKYHRGKIAVLSEPGEGSTFHIFLPILSVKNI